MSWLSQNWLWIVLGFGVLWFLGRGGLGWGRQFGHPRSGSRYGADRAGEDRDRGIYGSTGALPTSGEPQRAIDPVTRHDVSPDTALTSIYQGRIYYFENAETRQRFEASPQQYAREEFGRRIDQPQTTGGTEERERPRRRGGC